MNTASQVVIKTGTLSNGCAVAVGGHRLLTPHGKSERFSGTLQAYVMPCQEFPRMCGVEPHNTIINALTQLFPPRVRGLEPYHPDANTPGAELFPHAWG